MKTERAHQPNLKLAILTFPIRLLMAIFVYAPVAIILKVLTKVGQYCAELGEELEYGWRQFAEESSFLLHGKSVDMTRRLADENRRLKERQRFYDQENKTPETKTDHES